MFKKIFFSFVISVFIATAYSQEITSQSVKDAIENNAISESLEILKKISDSQDSTNEEKIEASLLVAQILEMQGDFSNACYYYTSTASLLGANTVIGQHNLLDAVRCTLSIGDVSRGDFLLSTAMANAKDNSIRAKANIYAVWSWVLKTQTQEELDGPISVLETYVEIDSMYEVRPTILLTLYHLTHDDKWGSQLEKEFPDSPEAAIVTGSAKMSPSPFWYFN